MKKILHPGFHKTGTTSIQSVLAENRDLLTQQGIWYPNFAEMPHTDSLPWDPANIERMKRGVGHFFFAHAVAEGKTDLSVFRGFLEGNERTEQVRIVSAEAMNRHGFQADNSCRSPLEQKKAYLERVASVCGSDCEVFVTIRRHDLYAESMYSECIRRTRFAENFRHYIRTTLKHYNYLQNLTVWRDVFGRLVVLLFEDLVASPRGLVREFLVQLTGFDIPQLETPNLNPRLPAHLLEFKRILNRAALSDQEVLRVFRQASRLTASRPRQDQPTSFWRPDERKAYCRSFEEENRMIEEQFEYRSEGIRFPDAAGSEAGSHVTLSRENLESLLLRLAVTDAQRTMIIDAFENIEAQDGGL